MVLDISFYRPGILQEPRAQSSLRDALKLGGQILGDAGIESALLDARLLLLYVTGYSNETIVSDPEKPLAEDDLYQYLQLVIRRSQYEPIAYITGKKSFWSLDFEVTCDTLIPRPDSETLIELCLHLIKDRSKPSHIVDLGTGSGCLLLSLLSEIPKGTGIGVDVSDKALEVATRNASELGFSHRAKFIRSNWCENLTEKADIIISNPPYIAPADMPGLDANVVRFEPPSALTDGIDGLSCYRAIATQAKHHLKPEGFCVVEMGHGQAEDVQTIFAREGWDIIKIERDLAGIPRALAASIQP